MKTYKNNVKKRIEEIKRIRWFRPMPKPNEAELKKQIEKIYSAFHLKIDVEIMIKPLNSLSDWNAARDAARGAAWNAAWNAAWDAARDVAWDAARDAAWEVSADVIKEKGWKINPFNELMQLWAQGFYVCGVVQGKFLLYYVPMYQNRGGLNENK